MAKLSHANSRRMYSWWWDSHISPKNSRWLHENLTDMDAKVKSMIKLIEQDADSFARRAEMYYEKRPELMKMVEEFYRAYRALAERYDHATGALRQAHQTITEAFPDQEPSGQNEDELANYANENNPQTLGHGDDGKFQVQRARSGLSFDEAEENDQNNQSTGKLEKEIQTLREALAKFEAEKESSLAYYKQSLEKLSHQELEFSNVQEERANKAEDEVESFRNVLRALEVGKEKSLVQYQKCLEKIEEMEGIISSAQKDVFNLNEQARKAETEAQTLKLALATMESEKAISLGQCKQSSEKILNLENKLVIADDEAKKLNNRAEEAEAEAKTLKQALTVLGVDKDAIAFQYQECLDTISSLERKVSCLQEEVQVLTCEVNSGFAKLKGAEEQSLHLERSNQSLHSEIETLKLEMRAQRDELTEKKQEMDKFWTSVQEERLRFVEAEVSFQASQHSHAQTEEQLKSLALELQNMQSEILSLREIEGKLEEEIELRVDQKNALQQEFYSLKEELNDVKNKYHAMLDQVDAVGFNSKCFQSAVKDLQDENLNLKGRQEKEITEKMNLLKKLQNHEKVIEKNALLEKSLSDLSSELEGAKEKITAMEKSFQFLSEEKSTLDSEKASIVTQLQVATENLEKLSEKNTILEDAVSDAHGEIEGLKIRLSSMEDSCQLLENEKSDLINEKVTLVSQVEKIEAIEKKHRELEEKHSVLEEEKESSLCAVEELQLIVKESKLKEEKQMTKIVNLHGKVLVMQKTCITLQDENLKLIDEKISLVKDFLDLQEKNDTLEGENISILGETASLSNLSLIFKNIINEANRYQKNEIDLWESEATKLSSDLHTSSVSRALLEEKFHELTEALKSLEEEANSKDGVIKLLKERITTLEAENDNIRAQLAAYVPAISSLKDCISSLENSTCFSTQLRDNNDEIMKAAIASHVESHEESSVDRKHMDIVSELQQLEARVKAVTRQIEELGSKGVLNQDNIKPLSVNSELQNGLLTKDIILDQILECTSYGIGRKECISTNSQSIRFDSNITTPTKEGVDFESGVIVEKELGVDKLTIANRISLPNQELDKPKILESLNSDSQKLTNLQTIVRDLKRKVEMSEKMREDKSFGKCESVEEQLEKAEEDIMQLSDLTKKLMKSVDESDDIKDVVDSEENRNLRRKFSEQARKVSERIGQLQLEVQEIQSIMLKLDDENGEEKNKRKSETSATKRRTSLRNCLGLKTSNWEKKRVFCGFVQPPTNEG